MNFYVALTVSLIFIIFSTFFSMSDMVYSSVNTSRLKKEASEGNKSSARAYKLAINYDNTISTILLGNNAVNVGLSSSMVFVTAAFGLDETIANLISIIISLVVLLLFGEVIPKQIAKIYNYRLSKIFAPIILVFKYLFLPFTFVFTGISKLISKIFLRNGIKDKSNNVDAELKEMVDVIEDEGLIDEDKADLVRNAIEFNTTEAYEIMKPRVDIEMFDINSPISSLISNKSIFNFSRIPLYEDDKDHIVGILPIKILQKKILAGKPFTLLELSYVPTFVPRTMKITDILLKLKESKHHMAIVLDEYGGVEGIITMEDILEEIVGDIWDETDDVEKDYSVTKGGFIVDGSMNIDDFFELFDLKDRESDNSYTTVNGWIIDKLERFGKIGDKLVYKNITVEIIAADEFTVEKIKVIVNDDDLDDN
ncbi:MAG: hemolysin family protein [Bacilli bacterium]